MLEVGLYVSLCTVLIAFAYFFKGFAYRHIFFLILGGALYVSILQWFYISFEKDMQIELFFIEGTLSVKNYIQNTQSYFQSVYRDSSLIPVFFSLLIPATIEEVGKLYVFKKIGGYLGILQGRISSVFAMIYVALGFAVFETMFYAYFLLQTGGQNIGYIIFVRACISSCSHILFSSIFAYYYARAHFIEFELIDDLQIGKTVKLFKKIRRIPFLGLRSLSHFFSLRYIITGAISAILLHTVYNFFMLQQLEILAILTILLGLIAFIYSIFRKQNSENYKSLREKILYLKQTKELKDKIQKGRN